MVKQVVKVLLIVQGMWFIAISANAQRQKPLTHADTLRGTYGPTRDWWDILKYDIHATFNIADSSIDGYVMMEIKVLKKGTIMQIDLQEPMEFGAYRFSFDEPQPLKYQEPLFPAPNFTKDGNAYMLKVPPAFAAPSKHKLFLLIFYKGKPRVAKNPPWDGGLVIKKDQNNNPWVTIACQGLGASVWYPCKDHQADEPDSAEMHITVPDSLVCVGNGRMRGMVKNFDHTATYDWAVVNPINNYCIIPYIGKYVHFGEVFKGEKGDLNMDYWVLDYNLEKAKKQFADAPRMMKAFEYWFGPYPFYEDGYKLVEAPHLGMEHQSATAYGNHYVNGYYTRNGQGRDLSGTGWGLKWDFIIVHESGHEWFANNITSRDIADMWIHESFTNYSETLFTDYYYGHDAGNAYVIGVRKLIQNDIPIIAQYNVNRE
ncbi:MAG TPA: M1 family metallopeptidase, partial [Ferruginibacter sp.]|nr:M1 family metallopeptidase [Ferruginibacter sp.]